MRSSIESSTAEILQFPQPQPRSNGFLRLDHSLLRSSRWHRLPGDAVKLYVDIAGRYDGRNNGGISYSLAEGMASIHKSDDTVRRNLSPLQTADRLVCTQRGYSNPNKSQASLWLLPLYTAPMRGTPPSTPHQCGEHPPVHRTTVVIL